MVAITRPRIPHTMYATLRQYAGVSPTVFDTLMGRKADIETLIRQVPGFVQYDLVRTADGMTTMTICNDKAGTEASNTKVAEWIGQNLPTLQTVRAGHHRGRGHPALHCLSTPSRAHCVARMHRSRASARGRFYYQAVVTHQGSGPA